MKPRKAPRYNVLFSGSFSTEKKIHGDGIVTDLSPEGCRVASETKVPEGTPLEMRIDLDATGSPIEIPMAIVRWCRPGEFGLEFFAIEPEGLEALRRLLKALEAVPFGQRGYGKA